MQVAPWKSVSCNVSMMKIGSVSHMIVTTSFLLEENMTTSVFLCSRFSPTIGGNQRQTVSLPPSSNSRTMKKLCDKMLEWIVITERHVAGSFLEPHFPASVLSFIVSNLQEMWISCLLYFPLILWKCRIISFSITTSFSLVTPPSFFILCLDILMCTYVLWQNLSRWHSQEHKNKILQVHTHSKPLHVLHLTMSNWSARQTIKPKSRNLRHFQAME